jgi:hypothetical protein
VNVIRHQVPFLDRTLLLLGQLLQNVSEIPPDLPKIAFFRYFGMNTT